MKDVVFDKTGLGKKTSDLQLRKGIEFCKIKYIQVPFSNILKRSKLNFFRTILVLMSEIGS